MLNVATRRDGRLWVDLRVSLSALSNNFIRVGLLRLIVRRTEFIGRFNVWIGLILGVNRLIRCSPDAWQ